MSKPPIDEPASPGGAPTRLVATRIRTATGAPDAFEPHVTWARSPLAAWLGDHGGKALSAADIIGGACDRLLAEGVPLARVSCALEDVHPQIDSRGVRWSRGEGVAATDFAYSDIVLGDSEYLSSPIRMIDEGGAPIRRRLHAADCPMDYPVLEDLRKEGITDYIAAALVFSDETRHFISWATDEPGGFTDRHVAVIDDAMALLSLRLEIDHTRYMTRTLLCTYLGHAAAERVIGGTIRRYQCETMHAVMVYSDLRGSTEYADGLPPEETIRLLGLYHETVAKPIQYFNGDIVKIIGDGILSIFPVPPDAPREQVDHVACGAHAAVRRAIAGLESIDPAALPSGVERLRAGFALHAGDVAFGNVGSTDRLDFTVIGPAVNEVVRVESLTKTLQTPILTTSAFAGLKCTVELESVGFHQLKGVREPKELFRPVGSEYS